MPEDILTCLSQRKGEPSLILFCEPKPSRLVFSNGEGDQAIIPADLLPESQRDGRQMVDAVEAVKHLVKRIRELEDFIDRLDTVCPFDIDEFMEAQDDV